MRHFIAYHNTDHMGRPLHDGDPLRLLTNKTVQHLLHNVVWFVQGDGKSPKKYSLGSVFVVSETGETGDSDFKWYARGHGHIFQPIVPLDDLEWFPDFLKAMTNFSRGVAELQDVPFIENLLALATDTGFEFAE